MGTITGPTRFEYQQAEFLDGNVRTPWRAVTKIKFDKIPATAEIVTCFPALRTGITKVIPGFSLSIGVFSNSAAEDATKHGAFKELVSALKSNLGGVISFKEGTILDENLKAKIGTIIIIYENMPIEQQSNAEIQHKKALEILSGY